MKNSLKRILTLLPVLIMVCLLAVAPVALADGREGLAAEERGVADAAGGVYKVDGDVDKDIRKVALFTDGNGGPKILVEEYSGEDVKYGNEGYYIEIDAKNQYNTNLAGLTELVQKTKPTYTAIGSDGKEITLNATWYADPTNLEFRRQGYLNEEGQALNLWYYFTATLTVKEDENGNLLNPNDYILDLPTAKAYVRVYPLKAVQTLTPESAIKTAQEIEGLTDIGALDLPTEASIAYNRPESAPEEQMQTFSTAGRDPLAAFMRFPAAEDVIHIATPIGKAQRAVDAAYNITGWIMDDKELTPEALNAKAAAVSDTNPEVVVELTPRLQSCGYSRLGHGAG